MWCFKLLFIFIFNILFNYPVVYSLYEYMSDPELLYHFNTVNRNVIPDYEIVYLPVLFPVREAVNENTEEDSEQLFEFEVFGRPVSLKLRLNQNLVSSSFKTYIQHGEDHLSLLPYTRQNCHYLHRNEQATAAISICEPKLIHGLLFLDNTTLEIQPLSSRLNSLLEEQQPQVADKYNKVPHIIKKVSSLPMDFSKDNIFVPHNMWHENQNIFDGFAMEDRYKSSKRIFNFKKIQEAASHKPVDALTAELALFFDAEAYKIFSPYFNYDDNRLRDMLLAYMNAIQALYHHPTLGTSLQLVLVRLDIMKHQPSAMPHYDGERSKLLDSFCAYQKSLNSVDDEDPNHWDMALYVSGLDFFHYENGRKSGVTMGLATVGGVCLPQYACVIAEMGTTNMFGKPYPSAGFTSVYILAHEIGHNLGMHHDSSGNNCAKEGYIMSPSRGVAGETQWSTCSAQVMQKLSNARCLRDFGGVPPKPLDHSKYLDTPGQVFTAKKQCEILLRDRDATLSPNQELSSVCYSIQCSTPHRSGYYFAGPALEGTDCGRGKYCYGGECVSKVFPTPVPSIPGGWSAWRNEECNSECIEKSRGYQKRHRLCNNPPPVNTDQGCEGSSYSVALCKDDKICRKVKRKTAVDYASVKCKEFSKLLPKLDPEGAGLQAPHEEARIWMGCAIFCRRKDSKSYYTPKVELNDLGVSPYFPDGTWCHTDKAGEDYFCLHHHCLPKSFELSKQKNKITKHLLFGGDIPFSQNAYPYEELPLGWQQYLSLGPDGRPLQTVLKPDQANLPKEEEWETKDYIELPDNRLNEIPDE